jgi:NADP-dependent 3-hydroxy acid dehydrogenase YdfG
MADPSSAHKDIAVITGAAGGMGAAVAARLASVGWPLVLCDLHAARLERMAAEYSAGGCSVEILAGDIGDDTYPARLTEALGARDIGAFIHTAGLSPTMADAERILRVNFDATARLVDVARQRMVKGGCAVLIASSAAHMVKSNEWDRALTEAVAARSSAALLPLATRCSYARKTHPISPDVISGWTEECWPRSDSSALSVAKASLVQISPGECNVGRLSLPKRLCDARRGQMGRGLP